MGLPRPGTAPLDSCLRRNDERGAGCDGGRVRVTAGMVPLSRDGRFANRPYGTVGELGKRKGLVVGAPRPCGYRLSPV